MGEWLTGVFFGWIYDVFYTLQKSICYLLDFIRDIFCKLAGIETVKIDGGEEEILTHFITSPAIRNAFLGVLLVGVILLGIAGGLVILVMFVMSAVMFVQRIFDIILLYIVSPASVSTIPLDDGGRFRIWREMLVSKVLSAYGIILSMNIFFLVVPQISQITFFGNAFKDGIVQLLFVIGGAFSITKANMIIAQLTGSNAGMQEMQQMMSNVHSGMHMVHTAGRVAAGAAGMIIGGTDLLTNRKHNATIGESLSAAIHSTRNQRYEDDGTDDDPGGGPDGGGAGGASENGTDVQDAAKKNDSGQNTPPADTEQNSAGNATPPAENRTDDIVSEAASADVKDTQSEGDETAAANVQSEQTDNVEQAAEKSRVTFGSVAKGATRLATLPAGMLKDMIQGGVITAGKNFIPRVKNIVQGKSAVNHAVVRRPIEKAKSTDKKENKKE